MKPLARALAMTGLLLSAGTVHGEEPLRVDWSVTTIGAYTWTESPQDDDDVGGFFDQYEFTPNKSSDFTFEIGIRDLSLDVLRGDTETAVFQARFRSPGSNLGVSGSQIDDPFFNQRLDASARLDGFALDLRYWRMRSEELRRFPNTEGGGLLFDDRTRRRDRFYRERTGFFAEARLDPEVGRRARAQGLLRPELRFRGGYEERDGRRQLRFHRSPSGQWLGSSRSDDREIADLGVGLLVATNGSFTASFDFDYEQLRFDDPVFTDGDLGFGGAEATRAVGFIPETNRYTGSLALQGRIFDRVSLEGRFMVSEIEQVSAYTPDQNRDDLRDNRVRSYHVDLAFDWPVRDSLSWRGRLEYDRRDNEIERTTPLFDPISQVDPFLQDWERFYATTELEQAFGRLGMMAMGVRVENVDRDLDFADPAGLRILPENTHIARDTRIVTLFGRGQLRPARRLRLNGELGYRWAPDTGYATELDDNVYGSLRASYVIALSRPVVLSAHLRGSRGENEDFALTSGQGPVPVGERVGRSFERSRIVAGGSATVSPLERLSVTASVFYARDEQEASLDLSDLQRYFQDVAPIGFAREGKSRFENEQTSFVLGLHARLTDRLDATASYSYTRAEADYDGSSANAFLGIVEDSRRIESDIHVLETELRHRVADGLELLAGYRFQDHEDDAPVPESVASVVRSRSRSTSQHRVTVGITLTSEFLE